MQYNPNLKRYSFGSWLGSNAGAIGTVAGGIAGAASGLALTAGTAGAGAALLPGMISAGASMGGSIGGAAQSNYEGNESADAAALNAHRMNQQQMAQNELQGYQQQRGVQNFAMGGPLKTESAFALFSNRGSEDTTQRYHKNNLTPTSQRLIEKNYETPIGSDPIYMKNVKRGGPSNFYSRGPGGSIQQFVTNRPMSSDRQQDIFKFIDATSNNDQTFQIPTEDVQPQLKQRKLEGGGQLSQTGNFRPSGLETYSGQTHQGPQGGIPVSASGSPAIITGEQPVGLTENNESSYTLEDGSVYIFSDKLMYNE